MKLKVSGGYLSEHTRSSIHTLKDWPDDVYPPLCSRCRAAITPGMQYVIIDKVYVFCGACDPGAP